MAVHPAGLVRYKVDVRYSECLLMEVPLYTIKVTIPDFKSDRDVFLKGRYNGKTFFPKHHQNITQEVHKHTFRLYLSLTSL